MIHYQLRCGDGHGFEGWFRDSLAFDDQADRGLLSCPQCGAKRVERALMAPAVRSRRTRDRKPDPVVEGQAPDPQPAAQAVATLPDQLRAELQRMRAQIERNCDDVGDGFADAARRLHEKKDEPGDPVRGIYGQTTEPEREALADEGIEIMQIPWLPRAES